MFVSKCAAEAAITGPTEAVCLVHSLKVHKAWIQLQSVRGARGSGSLWLLLLRLGILSLGCFLELRLVAPHLGCIHIKGAVVVGLLQQGLDGQQHRPDAVCCTPGLLQVEMEFSVKQAAPVHMWQKQDHKEVL